MLITSRTAQKSHISINFSSDVRVKRGENLDWKSENLTSWQLLLLTNCKTRHQKILSIVTDHLDHYLANAKLLIV